MQCQFCGEQFSAGSFNKHVNESCPSRPSDHLNNLPVFDLPATEPKWGSDWPGRAGTFDVDNRANQHSDEVAAPEESNAEDEAALLRARIALAFSSREDNFLEASSRSNPPGTKDVCAEAFKSYWSKDVGARPQEEDLFLPPATKSSTVTEDYSRRIRSREVHECTYCGQKFAGHEYAQRILHQRVCELNPTHEQRCCFCGLAFVTNFENLATELVADHEDLCMRNPSNICKYCSQGFGGVSSSTPVQKLRYKLEMHMLVCASRPNNFTECKYCGQPMAPTLTASADDQLQRHLLICTENPRHACRFCGRKFTGTLYPPEDSPVMRRRTHEYECPIRRKAGDRRQEAKREAWTERERQKAEFWRRQTKTHADTDFRLQEWPSEAEDEWRSKDWSSVEREKQRILRDYKACTPQQRRAYLRSQQLKWHPDRRLGENPKLTNSVFCMVQKLWEEHQQPWLNRFG